MQNNMIIEDYVSFETAKLLKEKGFDWDCKQVYDLVRPQPCFDGKIYDNFPDENPNAYNELVSAPTLQMAMKWLREVHKMYMYVAHDSMENTWFARVYNDYKTLSDVDNHSTYEEACEAAIKYCLENLI